MGFLNAGYKEAKAFAKEANAIGAAGIESVEAEKARTLAAEQAKQKIFVGLGAPGSYDLPGSPGYQASSPSTGDVFTSADTFAEGGSPLARLQFKGGGYTDEFGKWKSREGILDPDKYAEDIGKSAQFRIQSRRTAEAEQLLAQEGPMWDQLSNSVYGVINEGAATQLREDVRALKTNAAKGGTARRTALAEAQQMQAQEAANQMRVQQTWKANLALFDVVRANADNVQKGNYTFIDNLPHIQGAYQSTMSNLANMLSSNALPAALAAKQAGYDAKAAHPKISVGQRIIGAVIGGAMGYASGGGGMGSIVGGLGGALGGAIPEAAGSVETGLGFGALGGLLGQSFSPQEDEDPRIAQRKAQDAKAAANGASRTYDLTTSGAWNTGGDNNAQFIDPTRATNRAYSTPTGTMSSLRAKLGLR